MAEIVPDVHDGDFLSMRWLNALRRLVVRNRVSVARDCGLIMTESTTGKVIGLTPEPTVFLGITSTSIPGRDYRTVYFGSVQPYVITDIVFSGALEDHGTMVASGPPVRVYNWTGSVIPSDVWIKYMRVNGRWCFNGNDCSGVAP